MKNVVEYLEQEPLLPETSGSGQTEHEIHCDSCVDLKKCTSTRKLRLGTSNENKPGGGTCPIVSCHLDCSRQFHKCKTEEHALLCPRRYVPCINVKYGCFVVLPREKKGPHLADCPVPRSELMLTSHYSSGPPVENVATSTSAVKDSTLPTIVLPCDHANT